MAGRPTAQVIADFGRKLLGSPGGARYELVALEDGSRAMLICGARKAVKVQGGAMIALGLDREQLEGLRDAAIDVLAMMDTGGHH